MKKGFTMVELMVVVVIMGVLASIALPNYKRSLDRARLAEATSVVGANERGIDMYRLQNKAATAQFLRTGGVRLDVDLTGSLNCNESGCSSQFFTYEASCNAGACSIQADPTENFQSSLPSLNSTRGAGIGAEWVKTCSGTAKTKELCGHLQENGFTAKK